MANVERGQIADLVRKAQAGDSEAMNELMKTAYKNVLFRPCPAPLSSAFLQ